MPRIETDIIERVNYWTFQVGHHFQVIIILIKSDIRRVLHSSTSYLNIVTADNSNIPIDNHELSMKCSKYRAMVILDLQIDMRYLFRRRKADILFD